MQQIIDHTHTIARALNTVGLINIQFVQDVVNILVDEIEDPELIKKIAAKLKVLMASKDNE